MSGAGAPRPDPERLARALRSAPLAERAGRALEGTPAWAVGGAVRDAAMDLPVVDLDLAVDGDPEAAARRVRDELGGAAFELSAEHGSWRVADRDGEWQVDLTALRGPGIEADLAARDFTVGAVAVSVAAGGGASAGGAAGAGSVLDPHGGLADLAEGRLRAVGPDAFEADPLRLMRIARLAAQFGWEPDGATVDLARRSAPSASAPAGERQLAELTALIGSSDPVHGLEVMERIEVLPVVLPEIAALGGVAQGPNHHLDVFDHTIEVLRGVIGIEADLDRYVGGEAEAVGALLAEPLADGASRSTGLRLGALFHDVAKPATRREAGGSVTFIGHDVEGAEAIESVFGRLRASRKLTGFVAALARHHLRLGFMVAERPLPARRIHSYLRATEPVTVEVTLLTVADRLAARGSGALAGEEMIAGHLELAAEMVGHGIEWARRGPPPRPISGDELAARLGIEPGPELGRILEELEAAAYAGELGGEGGEGADRAEAAVAHARRFLAAGRGES